MSKNDEMKKNFYELSVTTQGPTYPPSELLDAKGNFIVIGKINKSDRQTWGCAIVSNETKVPEFGENCPYDIISEFTLDALGALSSEILYTLPLPLPCNNYPMEFAPSQPKIYKGKRKSFPLHQAPIPDERDFDGRKQVTPIVLGEWIQAHGQLEISISDDKHFAEFNFTFSNMVPNSLYTIMALRKHDMRTGTPMRPGPLGIPNVFITDSAGKANYWACMPNPFPVEPSQASGRIINTVVLWMSSQMSYGGAIGHYGLGVDIHAQLKLQEPSFSDFKTFQQGEF